MFQSTTIICVVAQGGAGRRRYRCTELLAATQVVVVPIDVQTGGRQGSTVGCSVVIDYCCIVQQWILPRTRIELRFICKDKKTTQKLVFKSQFPF